MQGSLVDVLGSFKGYVGRLKGVYGVYRALLRGT